MYGEPPQSAAAALNGSSRPASDEEGQPEDKNIQAAKEMKMHQTALDLLSKQNLLPQEASTHPMTPAEMSPRAPTPQGLAQTAPSIPPTPDYLNKVQTPHQHLVPIMAHYLRTNSKPQSRR